MAFSKKESNGKIASKQSINFAEFGKKQSKSYLFPAVCAVIFVIIAVVIGKFCFLDRLDEVQAAVDKTARLEDELSQARGTIESFGDLVEKYSHLTYTGMTEEEITRSDRVDMLNVVNSEMALRHCHVSSWTIKDNTIIVVVTADSATTINRAKMALEGNKLVSTCLISEKQTNMQAKEGEPLASAKIKIIFNPLDRFSLLTPEKSDEEKTDAESKTDTQKEEKAG